MFALKGRGLIDLVLQHLPEGIEKAMQKRHTKWCEDSSLFPWSSGEEIGATLRISFKRGLPGETFALSWGVVFEGRELRPEIIFYEGDVAGLMDTAVRDGTRSGGVEARQEIDRIAARGVKVAERDFVGKVIEKIQSAAVAHKMLEGV
jgi:hypothetical protein